MKRKLNTKKEDHDGGCCSKFCAWHEVLSTRQEYMIDERPSLWRRLVFLYWRDVRAWDSSGEEKSKVDSQMNAIE